MDPATGTFTTMDTYGGSLSDPMSLHKYLFANSNPVMHCDPSGHEATLQGIVTAMTISAILSAADSGITYYLKYKDSDTAKYGKTVFGWNVATAAMNGFLKGFIIGIIGYALCALLAVRILLSVVGIILGFNRALAGMEEMDSSGGNAELGLYNFLAGIVTIGVSTWGLAKSGAEFIDKYGDGIEGFGKADEYPYDSVRKIIEKSNSAQKWGVSKDGTNQGVRHYCDYSIDYPKRIPSLEERLGVQQGSFDYSLEGFNNFTSQAENVIREATAVGNVRYVNGKSFYYVEGALNPKNGVLVVVEDGKIQSMMPSDWKSFYKMY